MKNHHKMRAWDGEGYWYQSTPRRLWSSAGFVGRSPDLLPRNIIFESCTGLKDKNGKLIYEGDILKRFNGSLWSVVFCNGCFIKSPVKQIRQGKNSTEIEGIYFEIIGNIHENPELLEAR